MQCSFGTKRQLFLSSSVEIISLFEENHTMGKYTQKKNGKKVEKDRGTNAGKGGRR